ncbi:putative NAD(P)H nitroreductase YodC [bioreactor metagenome]|uniref:Putative NAD(P)H nitroreductase YodC n=1 Tax=bioreactor metagenome TaxID=1076179 RepID=A0A644T1W3_9ZZZZ|nr:nitroreductase family protein [Negativicutes bacterium]
MTKDVFDCMRETQSVRLFQTDEIPEPTLTRILEAGCWAPSAGNLQPWYFYVIKNPEVKRKIADFCYDQKQILESPVSIVILADPARSNEHYGERGAQLYCIQDTAAATENMMLAADGLGIASCWVGAFDERKVQEAVEAPPRLRAVAILCLGYSNLAVTHAKSRLRVAEVTKFIN